MVGGRAAGQSPEIQGNLATFRYRDASAHRVVFGGESAGAHPIPMERQGDDWVLTREYPEDARDEYRFLVDGQWILDPCNPLRGPGGFGPRSECRMPFYVPPPPVTLPIDGRMERRSLAGRSVDVYVPLRCEGAALLIVQDGSDYIWYAGMPGLVDALIYRGRIRPTLTVFVSPIDRDAEYHPNDSYVDWLADRLLPALAEVYPIDDDPLCHGLVGASLGGSIATYGALRRPDAFRLVGAQSPAYRVRGHAEGVLGVTDAVDWQSLRFHIDGGRFEATLHGRDYLPYIRRGVDTLREQGCSVQYTEVNEGHNYTNWRGRLPSLLSWLLG